jgi:hypothetical protein
MMMTVAKISQRNKEAVIYVPGTLKDRGKQTILVKRYIISSTTTNLGFTKSPILPFKLPLSHLNQYRVYFLLISMFNIMINITIHSTKTVLEPLERLFLAHTYRKPTSAKEAH